MAKKLTIYDIATALELSSSTISTILRGDWQKRRINAATADRVMKYADRNGYNTNLTARGLRQSRSGLIGLILPMLDNRFFSSMAASFEELARERGLYPVVSSTQRDPKREQATVRSLLAHNVDAIVIGGATDPDRLSDICKRAGVAHVNIDLPGKKASTVLSDNLNGARQLTDALLSECQKKIKSISEQVFCFVGGTADDHNTVQRIQGFKEVLRQDAVREDNIHTRPSGYEAVEAEREIRRFYQAYGRLPDGLFVNSTIAFEGVVRFLRALPLTEIEQCVVGCFDWDPYIELLHFPVFMIRQDVGELVKQTFQLLKLEADRGSKENAVIVYVPTHLIDYR